MKKCLTRIVEFFWKKPYGMNELIDVQEELRRLNQRLTPEKIQEIIDTCRLEKRPFTAREEIEQKILNLSAQARAHSDTAIACTLEAEKVASELERYAEQLRAGGRAQRALEEKESAKKIRSHAKGRADGLQLRVHALTERIIMLDALLGRIPES